ncbi:hypothetical protein PHMEG_00018453 [Phytophthora megakarya]|uniref:Uncharacterized protein n=1 Tax=Phytophthora megakarya TaxID=4795 RepID=A0A225VU01_9STRA|nr:hypothetical protein PHMEG_00018453 [Phytophthora megakarya]
MHANDGSLAENWIFERGGWQLDRVNKAFGYMLGTTQADQKVARVLSGWKPKVGARLPSPRALEKPIRARALNMQALLISNILDFAETALNIDEGVAGVLTVTLVIHYPDVLLLADDSAFVSRMRKAMAARSIGESEVLAWNEVIRRDFIHP